jgi:hypothetical protein
LPEILIPGEEAVAMMRVAVPAREGTYQVTLFADTASSCWEHARHQPDALARILDQQPAGSSLQLTVETANGASENQYCAASLRAVHSALAEAERKQELPTDYLDVTHGILGRFKRWLKGKLLGNFKHAYVDILSRRQSAFNRQTLGALQELAECCTLLDRAVAARDREETTEYKAGKTAELVSMMHHVLDELKESRRQVADLEARLSRLEEWWREGERGGEVVRW